ncbi:hypothetical protein ENUP19_0295G0008 [Entamoeba nuttalli]|uniref:Uncharacterized protein n=2 Tax=Entamoeba nuttalli TaxID=412467 RepID=K2H7L1_ENTNP|nr:hypothetical protein ENU1_163880 [Entamoeba nuttalli P19]EKE38514.1 hypothetical protein ENU1_163880 [Entamoeba nuttalli P19]|eukprot:XP_008859150.1 hypothetical protein ENU1_163880 [Entamoeba nuttalli P19]
MYGTNYDSHLKPLFTEDENKKEKYPTLRKSITELSVEEIKYLDDIYRILINTNSFPTLSALEDLFNVNRITPKLLTINMLKGAGYTERSIPFGVENESIPLNYNFIDDMKKQIKNTPPQLVLTIEEIGYQLIQLKGKINCYFKGETPQNLHFGRSIKVSPSIICVSNDCSFIKILRVLSKSDNNTEIQTYFKNIKINDTSVNSELTSQGRNLYYTSKQFINWFEDIKVYITKKLNELKWYSKAIIYMHEYFKQFFTESSTDKYDIIFFNDSQCSKLSLLSPIISQCIKTLKENLNIINQTQEIQQRKRVEKNLNNRVNQLVRNYEFLKSIIEKLKSTNSLLSDLLFNLNKEEFTQYNNLINDSLRSSIGQYSHSSSLINYNNITPQIKNVLVNINQELELNEIIDVEQFKMKNCITENILSESLSILNLPIKKVWKYPHQICIDSIQLTDLASGLLEINETTKEQVIFIDSFEYLSDALQQSRIIVKNDSTDHIFFVQRENIIQRHLFAIREDGTLLRPLINENGISNSEMINWIIEIIRGILITTYPPKKIYFAVHQYYKFIFSDQQILMKLKTIPGGDMINIIYIEDAVYPIIPINIIFNKVLELILFKNQSLTTQAIENEIRYCLTPTLLNTLLYEWYELRKLKAIDYRVLKKQIDQFTFKPSNFVIIDGIKEGIDDNDPPNTIFNLDCVPPIYRQIMFDLLCSSPELKKCTSKNDQIEFISQYKNKYFFNVDEIFLNKNEPQKRLLIE